MTNYDIYKLVNFVTRKDFKGTPETLSNFNRLLQKANREKFKEEFLTYQANQNMNDRLSPFEVQEDVADLTTTTTTITLPTGYAHFIGMYWVDEDEYSRVFDLVTDDQWDMRCGSTLTIPTNEYPICKIVNDKLYIKPSLDQSGEGLLIFYGSGSVGLSDSAIEALSSDFMTLGNKSYTYNPSTQVCYVAYPSSYGELVSILDDNDYEVFTDWTLRSGIIDSVAYNIYEFNNLTTQTDFNFTFNF